MGRLIELLLMIAVVMAATNPDQDLHRKAVDESVNAAQTKNRILGKITAEILGKADAVPLTYNNYYLFSTTTRSGATASVGALSHVWKMQVSQSKRAGS